MTYIAIDEAKNKGGVRLVVTKGIPVPWGEAAKAILYLKKISHDRIAQEAGGENAQLQAWTGSRNAPILIIDSEPPLDRWADILVRLETLRPEPRLIPADETDKILMYGYIHELLEADGYIWNRRLWLNAQPESANATLSKEAIDKLRANYGFAESHKPIERMIEVVSQIGLRLRAQREAGSRYFIGSALTALDIYWAATCALLKPLPNDLCPLERGMRFNYTERVPEILAAIDPIIVEHRDYIYENYLELPLKL